MGFPIKFRFAKDDEEEPPKPKEEKPKKKFKFPLKFSFSKDEEDEPVRKTPEVADEKPQKKSFVLDWDRALGFNNDPFVPDLIEPIDEHIAGYKKQRNKLNLFVINQQKFGTIKGDEGTGKSMLLKWLYHNLKEYEGKVEVVYIDNKKREQSILQEIVVPLMTTYEKTVKKGQLRMSLDGFALYIKKKIGSKKLVILLDGVKSLNAKDILFFNKLYRLLKCMIIATDTKDGFDKSIFSRIDKMTDIDKEFFNDELGIKINGLDYDETEEMITHRIEGVGGTGIHPFHESSLRAIHKKSDGNPKEVIALCKKKGIELSIKEDDPSQDLTKIEEQVEETLEHEQEMEETEVTPTQRGADYKIAVLNKNEDFDIVEEKDKKGKKVKKVRSK